MKWSYDLTGAEPIIKDMPIYDATTIAQGELLMLGGSAFTAAADAGVGLVSAYPSSTGANQALNAVGISLATYTTNAAGNSIPPSLGIPTTQNPSPSKPSIAAAHNITTGVVCTSKVIINPFAVYQAEVTTADAVSVVSSASTNEFCVTNMAGTSGNYAGQYVFFCASAGPNFGSIRRVVSTATGGSFLLDKALTATITAADKVIFITPENTYSNGLSADALTFTTNSVGPGNAGTRLRVLANYVDSDGKTLLKQRVQGQKDLGSVIAKKTRFLQEVCMLSRAFA